MHRQKELLQNIKEGCLTNPDDGGLLPFIQDFMIKVFVDFFAAELLSSFALLIFFNALSIDVTGVTP